MAALELVAGRPEPEPVADALAPEPPRRVGVGVGSGRGVSWAALLPVAVAPLLPPGVLGPMGLLKVVVLWLRWLVLGGFPAGPVIIAWSADVLLVGWEPRGPVPARPVPCTAGLAVLVAWTTGVVVWLVAFLAAGCWAAGSWPGGQWVLGPDVGSDLETEAYRGSDSGREGEGEGSGRLHV